MATVKLTKNELKSQKTQLDQLQKYLPTLQLKKALLQIEVFQARQEGEKYDKQKTEVIAAIEKISHLLNFSEISFSLEEAVAIQSVEVERENIAGVDLPKLHKVLFHPFQFNNYSTPPWIDGILQLIQQAIEASIYKNYADERLSLLEHEFKEVSIRVNLFEKVLIPKCKENIRKIKIFLGDLQLSQLAQAKVAKAKILQRRQKSTYGILTSSNSGEEENDIS